MLNDADAKRYGTALANALRHMPVRAAQKTIDFTVLAFVMFEMETPRITLSIARARAAKPQAQPQPQATVYPLNAEEPAATTGGDGSEFGIQ
jgi:hypothetical protein